VLCLVMLLVSEDNLLRLYKLMLPGMALILTNFVVTQRLLKITSCAQPLPPTDFWSHLVSPLSGIVRYFGDKDSAYDCDKMLFIVLLIIQLALVICLINLITVNSSNVERIALTVFVNFFTVPCSLKLVDGSKYDVYLVSTLVCLFTFSGLNIRMLDTLGRMIRWFFEFMLNFGPGWMWYRARCPLLVSWLVAYSAQLFDSLLSADFSNLTYTDLMLLNLRSMSWMPMMYLGMCSVISYLADVVCKLVNFIVTRSTARQYLSADSGLSEPTLILASLVCFLINISTADMIFFEIPFLSGFLAARRIFRSVKALLYSDDRRTRIGACVVYLATSIALGLPSLVFFSLTNETHIHLTGNLFIALCFSIRGSSTLVQSFVEQWYCSTVDVGDADDVNLIVRVSKLRKQQQCLNAAKLFTVTDVRIWLSLYSAPRLY